MLIIKILKKIGKPEFTEKDTKIVLKELGFSSDAIYNIFSRGRSNFLSRLAKVGLVEESGKCTFTVSDSFIGEVMKDTAVVLTSPKGERCDDDTEKEGMND